MNHFEAADEPTEAFFEALRLKLLGAAAWMGEREPVLLRLGAEMKVFWMFSFWLENNVLELDLPPEFVAACGRCGLAIRVRSEGS